MHILHPLLKELKEEFSNSRKSEERGPLFAYTLLAIILPFTSSKTSNLLRALKVLFGFSIRKKKYYRFMASPKIPWNRLWVRLWKLIPEPETNGRLLVALDDFINPKTGREIFGCANVFDHAAKQNQSKYPWAQNVVSIGLLKVVKGRWACLPLSHCYYHLKKDIEVNRPRYNGKELKFRSKLEQAVAMLCGIAAAFSKSNILVVTDSWFGNNGMWKPLHKDLGERIHMVSRLRSNNNVFAVPLKPTTKKKGRPKKYGDRLGTAATLACRQRMLQQENIVNLYGKQRTVQAYDKVVMLKSLKCRVRVVWVYRKTQWVALFSTDLTLSVKEIIEYYGARWKIEACFKELKRDLGSAESQTRNAVAVTNHLEFCMMATTLTWVYASRLEKTPNRRHAVKNRNHFAFSDVRRLIAKATMDDNFTILCPRPRNSVINSFVTTLLRMAA